jgi:hypothetical protein
MKLYEITEQYRSALLMFNDLDPGELSAEERQQLLTDTLGDIQDNFRDKALNIGCFVANLTLEAEALKTMEGRILQRRKAAEGKASWLTGYLHCAMAQLGADEFKDSRIRLKLKKTPPKVILDDPQVIPEDYRETKVEVLIRKSQIAEDLKHGIPVPGAHLETGTRLEIR